MEITDPTKLTQKQKKWCKDNQVRLPGVERSRSQATWNCYSDAVGVNPIQRKAAMEHAAKIGVPTEFNEIGQAVFTGPEHRKRYCEAAGWFDRNGGYSDPQRSPGDRHPDA